MWWVNGSSKASRFQFDKLSGFTFVAAVEDIGESVGAFEVEKGSDRKDKEQADQQCSQKKRGSHTWPSC